jgi:hypothetical protein
MRSCYASQSKALSGMLWDSFTPWGMTVPSG